MEINKISHETIPYTLQSRHERKLLRISKQFFA